jgi:hypothetical protein
MLNEMRKEDLEIIDKLLDQVMEAGMEVECIYWALKAMQENPTLTPGEAFALGLAEWVK